MVWKREIASWKEGLADKRREGKGRIRMVVNLWFVNLWFVRPFIRLVSDNMGNCDLYVLSICIHCLLKKTEFSLKMTLIEGAETCSWE
jgi:hypothetical protein